MDILQQTVPLNETEYRIIINIAHHIAESSKISLFLSDDRVLRLRGESQPLYGWYVPEDADTDAITAIMDEQNQLMVTIPKKKSGSAKTVMIDYSSRNKC